VDQPTNRRGESEPHSSSCHDRIGLSVHLFLHYFSFIILRGWASVLHLCSVGISFYEKGVPDKDHKVENSNN